MDSTEREMARAFAFDRSDETNVMDAVPAFLWNPNTMPAVGLPASAVRNFMGGSASGGASANTAVPQAAGSGGDTEPDSQEAGDEASGLVEEVQGASHDDAVKKCREQIVNELDMVLRTLRNKYEVVTKNFDALGQVRILKGVSPELFVVTDIVANHKKLYADTIKDFRKDPEFKSLMTGPVQLEGSGNDKTHYVTTFDGASLIVLRVANKTSPARRAIEKRLLQDSKVLNSKNPTAIARQQAINGSTEAGRNFQQAAAAAVNADEARLALEGGSGAQVSTEVLDLETVERQCAIERVCRINAIVTPRLAEQEIEEKKLVREAVRDYAIEMQKKSVEMGMQLDFEMQKQSMQMGVEVYKKRLQADFDREEELKNIQHKKALALLRARKTPDAIDAEPPQPPAADGKKRKKAASKSTENVENAENVDANVPPPADPKPRAKKAPKPLYARDGIFSQFRGPTPNEARNLLAIWHAARDGQDAWNRIVTRRNEMGPKIPGDRTRLIYLGILDDMFAERRDELGRDRAGPVSETSRATSVTHPFEPKLQALWDAGELRRPVQ